MTMPAGQRGASLIETNSPPASLAQTTFSVDPPPAHILVAGTSHSTISRKESQQRCRSLLLIALGPCLGGFTACVLAIAKPAGLRPEAMRCAGLAVWIAFWWMSECLPMGVTSLLPLALFPPMHVGLNNKQVAKHYSTPVMWLFFGGFQLAFAIEATGLQKRVAMAVVRKMGTKVSFLLLGFMLAVAALSMFLSNVSTTVMILPVAQALITTLEQGESSKRIGLPFLLGIAYSASAGGVGTKIGTAPNGVFIERAREDANVDIGFGQFALFGMPIAFLLVGVIWLYLVCFWGVPRTRLPDDHPVFEELNKDMGPMTQAEVAVGIVFVVTVVCWTLSSTIRDWGFTGFHDSVVAVTMTMVLFTIRVQFDEGTPKTLMDWETLLRTPWNILFVFGGGFALGDAFDKTGLSESIGDLIGAIPLPGFFLMTILVFMVTFLTEFTSNTATANILLPILASLSRKLGESELYLMVPATLACSCAFMMPVATPPNAIVFGTGRMELRDMVSTGIALNFITGVVIVIYCSTFGRWALDY